MFFIRKDDPPQDYECNKDESNTITLIIPGVPKKGILKHNWVAFKNSMT